MKAKTISSFELNLRQLINSLGNVAKTQKVTH